MVLREKIRDRYLVLAGNELPVGNGMHLELTDTLNKSSEKWHEWFLRNSDGTTGGRVSVVVPLDDSPPYVDHVEVYDKGKGTAGLMYKALASHYGSLASNPDEIEDAAIRVWKKLKAKRIPDSESGVKRWLIEGCG